MNERDKPDSEETGDDPYLEDVIQDAVGPLAALLPAEELRAMKRALRESAKNDPTLAALHKAARPRIVPARSGDEAATGAEPSREEGARVVPLKKRGSAA